MAKQYQGVVLSGKRQTVTIQADSAEMAKRHMTEKFGPQFTGPIKNWVCGLTPGNTPGPEKYGPAE